MSSINPIILWDDLDSTQRMLWRDELLQLQLSYVDALDSARFEEWPVFFMPDARYTVQSRENFDRGLPLALMDLESQGMMRDRVYGVTQTIFHAPYYMRHLCNSPLIVDMKLNDQVEGGFVLSARTHYSVYRTKPGQSSQIYNVGCYHDEVVQTTNGLRFIKKLCVYDTELILNSLIYPI